jgi:hypothetical protein
VSKKTVASLFIAVAILLLGSGVYAASNFAINSGNAVNLAAGSQRVTTCDNDVFVDPPGISFDSTQQKYLLTTISVSQVSQQSPSGCGNWIMELALGYEGGYQLTSWTIPSSAVDSTFFFGNTNSGAGMAKTVLNAIDPTLVKNISLQMYPAISCADGGPCGLGDLGPGGGPVVYVAATPFTEPVSGKKYKYIEAAPAYWIPGVVDPKTAICSTTSDFSGVALSESIGYAIQNTNALYANSNCLGVSTAGSTSPVGNLKAAPLVRGYGSDWSIPTYQEAIQMCKFARFGAAVAPTKTNCNDAGGNSSPAGWSSTNYATSSKISMAGQIDTVNFSSGNINNSSAPINLSYPIRAIRYFG